LDYLGLPWITLDYPGLPWITLDYLGLPWITLDYLGLAKDAAGPVSGFCLVYLGALAQTTLRLLASACV
jgi:hypothetical protein